MKKLTLCFFAVFAAVCLLPAARLFPAGNAAAATLRVKGENGVYETDIEEFVARGVNALAAEIEGPETACALAVALRSCAYYVLENGCKHADCEFCEDPGCCFPLATETGGAGGEAAEKTRGETLIWRGAAAPALYTVCSGGTISGYSDSWNGWYEGGTIAGATQLKSFTVNSMVTSVGTSGGFGF